MARVEWPRAALSDVCASIVDCVNKTAPTVDEITPYKMIRTTNVRGGWIELDEVKYVTEDVYERWTRRQAPRRGDVILTREAPLGDVGLLRTGEPVFLGQRLLSYRADPKKLDNRFLLYALRGDDLQRQIKALASGATVEHLRVPDAGKLTLRLPPLAVQRRIADILSAYDDLIENNAKRVRILEEMARSLYRAWFVDLRFPGRDEAAPLPSSTGEAPAGWEVARLGDLAGDVRDPVDPSAVEPETPCFGLEHLPRRSVALGDWGHAGEAQSMKLRARAGDILFGKIRPYFHKVGVTPVDAVCSSDILVLRARAPEHFALVLCCVSSDEFVAHATQTSQGTKMPRASWDVLRKFALPLPPAGLLRRFGRIVTDSVDMMHRLVLKNRNLKVTRDLLLPGLVSGEIDVSGVDAVRSGGLSRASPED
ncbi:restriction endonuclease subunit S [Sorangium sp. So ce385]|uniref:restriction endonuclease subunit S n=1 Tax=Sorangium sp. So ce385 TaxID=3133308 RepID=UPI003F5BBFBA